MRNVHCCSLVVCKSHSIKGLTACYQDRAWRESRVEGSKQRSSTHPESKLSTTDEGRNTKEGRTEERRVCSKLKSMRHGLNATRHSTM